MAAPNEPADIADEELSLELPPKRESERDLGDDAAEEPYAPDDDSDLGLADPDDEVVGLDAEAGIDEPLEAELAVDEHDEDASFTDDGYEAAEDLEDDDSELDVGAEDGWTSGNEDSDDGSFDDDDLLDDDGHNAADAGEDGFDGEDDSAEIDVSLLPPLDPNAEAPDPSLDQPIADDLDLGPLGALIGAEGDEETHERAGAEGAGVRWDAIAAERVELTPLEGSLSPLCVVGGAVLGWSGSLWFASPGAAALERRFGRADDVSALAAATQDGSTYVALVSASGLACSRDAGRSFEPSAPGRRPQHLAFTVDAGRLSLWMAAEGGPLHVSDDLGRQSRVVQDELGVFGLWSDGARSVAALVQDRDGAPVLWHSTDAGQHWSARELPLGDRTRLRDVWVAGDRVLFARSAPEPLLVHARGDETWTEPFPRALSPQCLLCEGDAQVAYALVDQDGERHLARCVLGPTPGRAELVCPLPAGKTVRAIVGQHIGTVVWLYLATDDSILRVMLRSPDAHD